MQKKDPDNTTLDSKDLTSESPLKDWMSNNSFLYFRVLPLLFLALFISLPDIISLALYLILNMLYFVSQIFKLILIIISSNRPVNKKLINIKNLPTYTILLPLYKEDKVIKKLIKSLIKIDYPTHLLEIKILIEEDDPKSLKILRSIDLASHFEIILVPFSQPKTKPKALNYGLKSAKGKYIVVFDAEDHPHPQQLKQAASKFARSTSKTICVQAKLNYYNRHENQLTKLFSIEYSLLYDYMLVGLERLEMPIPLGGTSNHFITNKLRKIGGWDAFNVTEDADLGIRLYNQGYRCALINNTTLEESPINIMSWSKQRSRWIKGHILTSLLHGGRFKKLDIKQIIGIYFHLYLPNITYLLLPIYLVISFFIQEKLIFTSIFYTNIFLGITLPISFSILVIYQKKWKNMKLTIALSPFYYLLFPIAAIRSCWQIVTKPYHWDKTDHIITKYKEYP